MEVQHEPVQQVPLVPFPMVTRDGLIPSRVQHADNKKQRQQHRERVRLIAQRVEIVHQNRPHFPVPLQTPITVPHAARDRHRRQEKRELLTQTTQRLGHASPNTER